MPFQFRIFVRLIRANWRKAHGWRARLGTLRFATRMLGRALRHRLGFFVDDLVFRGYRDVKIKAPVFIVGAGRSGSTFLHRLLAIDDETFTSTRMWEILWAPSVTEKHLVLALRALSRGTVLNYLFRWPKPRPGSDKEVRPMHETGLDLPEEDEYFFVTLFASPLLELRDPELPDFDDFWRFDEYVPEELRSALMAYYRRCIQAHMYFFGRGRTYLAKAPHFTPKLQSLRATFPDARFVQLVRDPRETVSSSYSKVIKRGGSSIKGKFASLPPERFEAFCNRALDRLRYYYLYPLRLRDEWGVSACAQLMYHELISDPESSVRDLYRSFDIELSATFASVLAQRTEQARSFESHHRHRLEDSEINPDAFWDRFEEVYSRYDFPTTGAENSSRRSGSLSDSD